MPLLLGALAVAVALLASSASLGDYIAYAESDGRFITTWMTRAPGESITIPVADATGTYMVDWGDGTTSAHTGDATHSYAVPGTHQVQIWGDFTRFTLAGQQPNALKLISVDQWGDIRWITMESAFEGALRMKVNATDVPDLSRVPDLSFMFAGASSFNGDLSKWDTSNVTNMSFMFFRAQSFNSDISAWNTSNVYDMSYMFTYAKSFNYPIGGWDTSNVTDMALMMSGAEKFNYPIDDWDTSNVTDMTRMFAHATTFNQPLDSWDTSNVVYMNRMFSGAEEFNQPLDSWTTVQVDDMTRMFNGANKFNGAIGSWDTSNVTDMSYMFLDATRFNQPIGDWDTSKVTSMEGMFAHATFFNQPIGDWDTSNVTTMSNMFSVTTFFNQPIGDWDTSNVTDMEHMLSHSVSFNQPIGNWDTSNVTDMSAMFHDTRRFNQPIGDWDTSKVTNMQHMFSVAHDFNQPIGNWDTSKVTDMSQMFTDSKLFNQPIGNWDTSNVTDMNRMFFHTDAFNQPIGGWNTSNVTDMSYMFMGARDFDQPIGSWNVGKVTNMKDMFERSVSFSQNLGNWYVVPDGTAVDASQSDVARIAAQNGFLDAQNPTYRVAPGGDGDAFEMIGSVLRSTEPMYSKPAYNITIISEGGFKSPNSRDLTVTVTGTAGAGSLPLKSTVPISGVSITGGSDSSNTNFGAAVDVLGDLDGDGTSDFVVGAPGTSACRCTGDTYVLFMNSDGTVKRTAKIGSGTPNVPQLGTGDRFGEAVVGLGDLDGDGIPDMAVGLSGHVASTEITGDVFVMFMNSDGTVKRTVEINAMTPNGPQIQDGDRFGQSIANLGDLDGDGTIEIAATAPGHHLQDSTGDVFVMFMNSDGTVKRTVEINAMTPNGPSLASSIDFGASVANVGDLDGDGTTEIAVGAAGSSRTVTAPGEFFVIFMNPDGTVKRTVEINSSTPNVPALDRGANFAESLAGIGDVDGDGVPDIAAGAPGHFTDATATGDVYVMFMNSDGTVKRTAEIGSGTQGLSLDAGDHFGVSVTNAGDIDGDSMNDLLVGTYGDDRVYVLMLNSDGTVKRTVEIDGKVAANLPVATDHFGWSAAGIGDLDGDGVPDVAVGAPGEFVGSTVPGEAFVMYLNLDGTIKRTMEINSQTPNGPSLSANDRFGEAIAGIGDLDGDGVPDVAVGAPGHTTRGTSTGNVHLVLMNPDGTIKRTVLINSQTPNGPSIAAGDRFGWSVAGAGDVDGDGTPDMVAGAPGHATKSTVSGSVHLMLMNPDGTIKRTILINSQTPNGPLVGAGDRFGASVAGLGDLDGDGRMEIAAGAPGYVIGPVRSTGSLYVMSVSLGGEIERTVKIDAHTPNGPGISMGDRFGTSASRLGDLDGDGTPEIAVGAPSTTSVYVMFTSPIP